MAGSDDGESLPQRSEAHTNLAQRIAAICRFMPITMTMGGSFKCSLAVGNQVRLDAVRELTKPWVCGHRISRMPTDERYIASLRDDLFDLLNEAKKEDAHPNPISFPNEEWDIFAVGQVNIVYRRSETATAIQKLTGKVYNRRDWTRKWSESFIQSAFSKAMNQLGDGSPDSVYAAFANMARQLDEEPKARSVVFAVGGVALSEDELRIGSIRLFRMTEAERQRLKDIFHRVIDSTRATEDVKEREKGRASNLLQAYSNLTAAEIPTVGDVDAAVESAVRASEPVLDFLQLIVAIEEPSSKNIRIVGGGDLLARQPARFVISDDGTEINWNQRLATGFRLDLTKERVDKIVALGFQSAIDAMSKIEANRNEYEVMLLNAVHWIADAEKQDRLENRITSYTTAMELFFTAKDAPITRDLSENVAYLLGRDLKQRKEIQTLVKRLYEERSKVSHNGIREALEHEVDELKYLAINVVAVMCRMADRFESKRDVRALFEDLRMSAQFDPFVKTDAEPNAEADSIQIAPSAPRRWPGVAAEWLFKLVRQVFQR